MNTFYLTCFTLGCVLSILAAFGGLGRLHFGYLHFHSHVRVHRSGSFSAINGFTLPAFLCWFGGAGYLLDSYGFAVMPLVFLLATISGLVEPPSPSDWAGI